MKKIILTGFAALMLSGATGSALAADLRPRAPVYAPPAVAPAFYNWSGAYIGAHIGWGTARKEWTQTFPTAGASVGNTATFDADGIIGGGQIGYNWQTGNFVFGVEVDFSGSGMDGNALQSHFAGPAGPIWASFTDINWFGTATGRIGYAWDRVLVYGKGGFAWADETHRQTFQPAGGVTNIVSTVDNVHTGWTAGAGVEVALWDNWTGKIEYNYFDLGRENLVFSNTLAVARAIDNWDIEQRFHVVKAGLNYRWNWGRF